MDDHHAVAWMAVDHHAAVVAYMHSRLVVFDAGAHVDSPSVRHEQTDVVGRSQDH